MAISDEELDQRRARVEKLREQVAQEEAKRIEREADAANEITAAQLDAEATRLEAQLQMAKAANGAKAVSEGIATVTQPVKDEKASAVALQRAQESAAKATAKKKGA